MFNIHYLDTCTSTNDVALDSIHTHPHGTVFIARHQSKGRGRNGHHWFTDDGGLAISIIYHLPTNLKNLSRLTPLATTALLKSLHEHHLHVVSKWPNDILLPSLRKVGGILIEVRQQIAVIGIGLNLKPPAHGFPEEIASIAGSLQELNTSSEVQPLINSILGNIDSWLSEINSDDTFSKCIAILRENCITPGRTIKMQDGLSELTVQAIKINDDGSLLVKLENGSLKPVYVGDIVHL